MPVPRIMQHLTALLATVLLRHVTLAVVVQDLGKVPGPYIAAALVPALVITLLFFFDHSVSAQMAQQPEFRLEKPSAYHYDFFLLGIMTLACGLIGVPPVNGVLPQVTDHAPAALGGSLHDFRVTS